MGVLRAIAALILIAVVTAVLRMTAAVNPTTAGLVYLITILLIAARWGLQESVIASLAATLCFNYFFFPPVGTFHIEDPQNWISLSAFLVTSLVASQLSEMARRSHALATKSEAARQSEQFKSTLVDAVAHEFTTPLTSIKAAASTILSSESLTAEQRQELLTVIDQEADRLTALMREAFHLARVEADKLHLARKPHDVPVLIDEALRQASASLNGRKVDTSYCGRLPLIQVDADLFIVALKQIIDNAGKYSPPNSPVRVTAEASAESVWIRVHNQGPGLTEREQTMIFDRYYRSDSASKMAPGIGIGLAIAQDIVQAHGGYVNVESGAGMGTEFSIRLPLVQPGVA